MVPACAELAPQLPASRQSVLRLHGILRLHGTKPRALPRPRAASRGTPQNAAGKGDSAPAASLDLEGPSKQLRELREVSYLSGRSARVCQHFPQALGVDDFLNRAEVALYAFGFTGDNSIAVINLCRDEITNTLKTKLDQVFGAEFNVNGLGGVLTCGVTGMAAGLSHAPVSRTSGKERYVFFSFPHISIDAKGEVGAISRPGRPGMSCACGALKAALVDIRRDGLAHNCKIPGVHDARDPEYSILKQRLARRLRFEGASEDTVSGMSLTDITYVAERTITDDLEFLISQTVDPRRADYAVITGVQIHNWGSVFDDESPNLEFVAPTSVYAVVSGEKTYLDFSSVPSLSPRQTRLLARARERGEGGGGGEAADVVCNSGGPGTLLEIDAPYLYNSKEQRRREKERADTYAALLGEEDLHPQTLCRWPAWQSHLRAGEPHREEEDTSVVIDSQFESDGELDELLGKLQNRYMQPTGYEGSGRSSIGGGGGGSAAGPVSNTSGPGSLSTGVPGSSTSTSGSAAPLAHTGLLSRLLKTVKDAKERSQWRK